MGSSFWCPLPLKVFHLSNVQQATNQSLNLYLIFKNKMNYPFKKSASLFKDAAFIKGQTKAAAITHLFGNMCSVPDPTYSSLTGQQNGICASTNSQFLKEKGTEIGTNIRPTG